MHDLEVIQVDVARRAAAVRPVAEVAVVEAEDGRLAVGLQPLHRHNPRLVEVAVGLRFLAESKTRKVRIRGNTSVDWRRLRIGVLGFRLALLAFLVLPLLEAID